MRVNIVDETAQYELVSFSFDWMKNDACEVAVNPRGDSRVNSKISEVFNQSLDRDGFSVQITSLSQTHFSCKTTSKRRMNVACRCKIAAEESGFTK